MYIGKVNEYKFYSISKRRYEREDFKRFVEENAGNGTLAEDVKEAFENKGRICGIYKDKKMAGIYVFKRIKNYFVETDATKIKLGDFEFDLDKFWHGDSKDAYKLVCAIVPEELQKGSEKLNKILKDDIGEQIALGSVAGVEMGEVLWYRKCLKKEKGKDWTSGWMIGFPLGFVMGWLIFDSIVLGFCFGISYSVLFGGSAAATTKTEWREFDFVNPEVKGDDDATLQ